MRELRPTTVRPTRLERDIQEGEVGVELVARGAATSVRIQGLRHAERAAPIVAAAAQRAGVAFRIEDRNAVSPVLVIGPRLARLLNSATSAG